MIGRPKVLAIDDHPVNRLLISRQLESLGFDVDTVADGAAALSSFADTHYDFVVLDCAMPGMDGFEIARRVRDIEQRSNRERAFLVACTAEAGVVVKRRCVAAGMDDCLAKPSSAQAFSVCFAQARKSARPCVAVMQSTADTEPERVAPATIDIQGLADRFGTDEAASQALLKDFVEINAEDLRALQEALGDQDARAVARHAHRMLGASKMVGAETLTRIAARLEALAPTHDWPRIAAVASAMEEECRRVERVTATSAGVFYR